LFSTGSSSAVPVQFQSSSRAVPEQFQCSFRAVPEQFQSSSRAVSTERRNETSGNCELVRHSPNSTGSFRAILERRHQQTNGSDRFPLVTRHQIPTAPPAANREPSRLTSPETAPHSTGHSGAISAQPLTPLRHNDE